MIFIAELLVPFSYQDASAALCFCYILRYCSFIVTSNMRFGVSLTDNSVVEQYTRYILSLIIFI